MDHFLGQVSFPNSRGPKSVFPELCGPQRLFQACLGPKRVFLNFCGLLGPSWGPPHNRKTNVNFTLKLYIGWTTFGARFVFRNVGPRNSYFSTFVVPKGYFTLVWVQNAYFSSFASLETCTGFRRACDRVR